MIGGRLRLPPALLAVRRTMRAARARGRGDEGRAIVEFVFLGVLLLVPLIYLVLVVARLQGGAFAATTAAREAGRAFTTATSERDSAARARAAASISFEDFGFTEGTNLELSCDGSPCLRPDGSVSATASVEVRLPLVPDIVAAAVPSAVTMSATHVATVDRFAERASS